MDRLTEHLVGCWNQGKILPYVLELRVSHKCNLNCVFCPGYDKTVNQKSSLSTKKWKDVIKQASELDIKQCLFFSDLEPLMHKDALELMLEIKKHRLLGKITTNGTLLTKKVCEALVKAGWDEINVSLEGPDTGTNDAIRGRGVFKLVSKNLLNLKRVKEKIGYDKPKVMFHTVLTNRVYKKLDKMILLAHYLGVDAVNFHPISIWNQESRRLELTKEQYNNSLKYIKNASRAGKKLGVHTNIGSFAKRKWEKESIRGKKGYNSPQKSSKHPFLDIDCYLPWYFISVHEDGRVNPCHTIHESKENVKNRSLKDIWEGAYFNSIRKKIEEEKFPKRCYTNCCMMQSASHLELKKGLFNLLNIKA